jgi:hypothetical protein
VKVRQARVGGSGVLAAACALQELKGRRVNMPGVGQINRHE